MQRLRSSVSSTKSVEVSHSLVVISKQKLIEFLFRLHNDSKCGTIRSYSCHQCDSKFISQNTLNAHLMIHIGEKKHLCDFCGKKFLSRGQLQVHERCHTGEKPFKCNVSGLFSFNVGAKNLKSICFQVCEKAFSHRESLVTHSSLHTGVKPYVCEACESRFSCIGNLIKHRRARPDTCGLPQYSNNSKCAPRASSKRKFGRFNSFTNDFF